MKEVTGKEPKDASFEDFQREFKCKDVQKAACNEQGLQFPLTCSFPPCNYCPGNCSKFGVFYKTMLMYCMIDNIK